MGKSEVSHLISEQPKLLDRRIPTGAVRWEGRWHKLHEDASAEVLAMRRKRPAALAEEVVRGLRGRWHAQECVKYPRVGVSGTCTCDLDLECWICNQDPYFVVVEWLMQIYENRELFSPFLHFFGPNNLLPIMET